MHTILVIEDDEILCESIAELLTLEGFRAIGAPDGVIGLERVQEELPNLILCDVDMPRLNGFGVLEALRADPQLAKIPFLFMTAHFDPNNLAISANLDRDQIIRKPFPISDLMERIHQWLT